MKTLIISTLLILTFATFAHAVDLSEVEDATLVGIKAVAVLAKIDSHGNSTEFTEQGLQEEIIKKFNKAGLNAVPIHGSSPNSTQGIFAVVFEMIGEDNSGMFFPSARLLQGAVLVRDPNLKILAATWIREGRGVGLEGAGKEKLDLFVEQFINAWRAKNPATGKKR